MIVDLHAHALSERFIHGLIKNPIAGLQAERTPEGLYAINRVGDDRKSTIDPHLIDLPLRLASLRRRGVVKQFFGPPPFLVGWPGGAPSVELVRVLNRMIRDVADESEGLMEAIGVAPLGEPEKAADEVKRAVEEHGIRGLIIPSTAGGVALDEPQFEPFFDTVEKLGLVLFMHPTSAVSSDRFFMYGLHVLVGFPFETTLAVTRMIFNGVLERHPNLKLVLAHGGGNLVFLRGRLDSAYEAEGWESDPYFRQHITQKPSAYLDRLYYDTCALSERSNRFVIETMGADRVVFGSDYPFDIGDPEGKRSVPVVDTLPPLDREKVYSGNAIRLFGSLERK